MPGCCGGGVATKIVEGGHIDVTGSGSAQDPFVIVGDVGLAVTDTTDFDLTLTGAGTVASPWTISVAYAATSKLDDIPDVNASTPTNGQVLSWNSATSKWVPAAPTTAASGSVQHGNGFTGDGSVGTPLNLVMNSARFGFVDASGVGLTDAGINSLVRRFTDSTARGSASPVPVLNALSILDSVPGRVQYWDGTQWLDLKGNTDITVIGGQFLSLSGAYTGTRLTQISKVFSGTTDSSGNVDILLPADLTGFAGVIVAQFQETGAVGFKMVLFANTDRVSGTAYRLDDGTPYASQNVSGLVLAWLY